MQHDMRVYSADILKAVGNIYEFIGKCTFEDFINDSKIKSAVERQFEIIGEALARLERSFPEEINKITNYRYIIDFRNILAHGYDVIDDGIVWNIIQDHLPVLKEEIVRLLGK